jgi:4-hydroxy-2-oxoglutarate aldolase
MTVEALRRHFEAVADAASVPVYLYSVPAFTGLPWPAELTPLLAAHPRIRGLKESSGDINLFARITASVPNGFETACGNASVFYPALCLGAAGGVLGVSNCAPKATLALYKAFAASDHESARRIQRALVPLAGAMVTSGVAGLKLAMGLVGLRGGTVRAPLLPAAPSLLEEIRPLLAAVDKAL